MGSGFRFPWLPVTNRRTGPQALTGLLLAALAAVTVRAACAQAENPELPPAQQDAQAYHDVPSLIDWTPEQIRARPELRGLQIVETQQDLSEILSAVSARVKAFFDDVPDLTAREGFQSGPCGPTNDECGVVFRDHFRYFVGRSAASAGLITEYRADESGHPIDRISVGLAFGSAPYLTSGFLAASLLHFHPQNQVASRFHYFGRQTVDRKVTDVVGFAEIPDEYCCPAKFGPKGHAVTMYFQGLAWIDAATHQILRTQTFLLTPHADVDLEDQTTTIEYRAVRLFDTPTVYWLPTQVVVDFQIRSELHHVTLHRRFRNIHRFSDFRTVAAPRLSGRALARTEAPEFPLIPPPIQPDVATPSLMDWNPEQIRARPELRKLQPAESQVDLPAILRQVGDRVAEFFNGFPNITSTEEVESGPCSLARENCAVTFRAKYQYLAIGRNAEGRHAMDEYRADKNGRPIDYQPDCSRLARLPILTSGFAAAYLIHFHPQSQTGSDFRYFGRQRVRSEVADVVGFREIPGKYCCPTEYGFKNQEVPLSIQGLAWVDATTHQILRIQTELETPRLDVGLEGQTTRIEYSSVRLPEISTAFWLPANVRVDIWLRHESGRLRIRNIHRYSHYKLFRVASRIRPVLEK